ncbi:MAG: hypothetical protein A2W90_14110 [Bacteroidetes bacterium GWF2_42_66]|nr:MAG: hypothetical protein A2W92_02515 [Bacteroidetes bacterium GWA2_42_15]OFX96641.1 MAG: hypothetical protein A2W89_02400 [Bacteroidetes bacterium GWE2_42_39]OFY45352.1 MAG: hypothetical protein A2W90_14110 [Bacteroidetes bacterium GWF2_42_66]HAZ02363.1 hypothetical protein [Marinilabiliales bacterium]HBL76433.1 hypothetical protein [Prolixibacteraceae bacterium]
MKVKLLSKDELRLINGGAPSKDTSLAYDLFWGISWVFREVCEGVDGFISTCAELPPGSQIRGH